MTLPKVSDEQRFSLLEEFYDDGEISLPYLVTYSTGKYLIEPEISVTRPDGEAYTGDFSEESFADNCTEEEKAALRDFVERFLTAYIRTPRTRTEISRIISMPSPRSSSPAHSFRRVCARQWRGLSGRIATATA